MKIRMAFLCSSYFLFYPKIGKEGAAILMQEDVNFTTIERQMMSRAGRLHIPINGSIELLPLCNMNCDMCYVRLSPEEMKVKGRLRSTDEWISIAEEMKESGVLYLLLTGGEPLLYPGFRKLFLQLQSLGMVLTINTNGTLIDKDWVDFFAAHKPRRINITLYGASEASYEVLCHYGAGFQRVIRAVNLLKEADIDVKLSTSLTRKNLHDLEAMHDLAEELGVPLHTDTYMMPSTRERTLPYAYQVRLDPEQAARARIYALRREFGEEGWAQYRARCIFEVENILPEEGPYHNTCHAGKCSFTINWQGDIHPCVVVDHPSASVFEVGFEQAWQQVSSAFRGYTMTESCSSCNLRPVCRTCLACAALETGDYKGLPRYMCDYAKASYHFIKDNV